MFGYIHNNWTPMQARVCGSLAILAYMVLFTALGYWFGVLAVYVSIAVAVMSTVVIVKRIALVMRGQYVDVFKFLGLLTIAMTAVVAALLANLSVYYMPTVSPDKVVIPVILLVLALPMLVMAYVPFGMWFSCIRNWDTHRNN